MDWVHLFTSFEGRITRQPFWIAWAVFVAIEIAISLSGGDDAKWGSALDLVLIYPQLAVCAKRGHDRNTSIWVVGVFFAIGAILDVLLLSGWINPMFLITMGFLLKRRTAHAGCPELPRLDGRQATGSNGGIDRSTRKSHRPS